VKISTRSRWEFGSGKTDLLNPISVYDIFGAVSFADTTACVHPIREAKI